MNLNEYVKTLNASEKEKVAQVAYSFAGHPLSVVILQNGDFTEGRGPMLLHRVCDDYATAKDYISARDGIYGSRQCKSGVYAYKDRIIDRWNGYDIVICRTTTRDEVPTIDELAHLKPLIDKLSKEFPELWAAALGAAHSDKKVAVDRLKKALKAIENG